MKKSKVDNTVDDVGDSCDHDVVWNTVCLLGALVPHYRDLLLGTCLRACKDTDPLIRASAVSNLGQVCQHLHFSLGSVMHEVLLCLLHATVSLPAFVFTVCVPEFNCRGYCDCIHSQAQCSFAH